MKINNTTPPRTGDASEGPARNVSGPAASAATPAPSDVRMSPLSAQVRDIGAGLVNDADGDIDQAKVEEIRQAIAEGRLTMDSSKIADGLLASLRELAQGGQP